MTDVPASVDNTVKREPEDELDDLIQKILEVKGLPWTVANLMGMACGLVDAVGYSPLEAAELGMDIAQSLVDGAGFEGRRGLWDGLPIKEVN